jgi:hypothetical protein
MKYKLLLLSLLISSTIFPGKMPIEKLVKNFETISKQEFEEQLRGAGRRTAAIAFAQKKILELHELKRLPQLFNYITNTATGLGIAIGGLTTVGVAMYGMLMNHALFSETEGVKGLKQFGYLVLGCIGGLGLAATLGGGFVCATGLDSIQDYLTSQAFEEMKLTEITYYENFLKAVNESQ